MYLYIVFVERHQLAVEPQWHLVLQRTNYVLRDSNHLLRSHRHLRAVCFRIHDCPGSGSNPTNYQQLDHKPLQLAERDILPNHHRIDQLHHLYRLGR